MADFLDFADIPENERQMLAYQTLGNMFQGWVNPQKMQSPLQALLDYRQQLMKHQLNQAMLGKTTADTANVEEGTEGAKQNRTQKGEMFPLEKRAKQASTRNAELDLEVKDMNMPAQENNAEYNRRLSLLRSQLDDNVLLPQVFAESQKPVLDNQRARAQIDEAGARIGEITAQTDATRLRTGAGQTVLAQPDGAERVWGSGRRGGGEVGSAAMTGAKYYESIWKQGNPKNPDETDAQYAQRGAKEVAAYMTQQKRKAAQTEFIDFATKGGFDLSNDKAMAKALKAWKAIQRQFGEVGGMGDVEQPPAEVTPTGQWRVK